MAEAAALGLLERSVRMGHKRLAVQRLGQVVMLGMRVPDDWWRYCRKAAEESQSKELQELFLLSARLKSQTPVSSVVPTS